MQVFRDKIRSPGTGKRKIFHETGGLNLLRREEHGDTFAHEIEHFIGFIGIPLKEEEVIRYG
jgi:hypothetical protein